MTESKVRSAVGVFLILAQIGVVFLAIWIYIRHWIFIEDLTTVIGLILPMFTIHTTAIAKYLAKGKNVVIDSSPKVNLTFAALAFATPVLFVIYLCSILIVRANGLAFVEPEQLKWALGLGETLFAVYLANFIGTLFGEHH